MPRAPARKFRLTAPEPSEVEIHEGIADLLKRVLLPPAKWTTINVGHIKLTPAQAARLSRLGVQRGWPDLIIVFNGMIFGVEIKRRSGALSKTRVGRTATGAPRVYLGQEDVFAELLEAGMPVAVVRDASELLHQLHRWGIPIRYRVDTWVGRQAVAGPVRGG